MSAETDRNRYYTLKKLHRCVKCTTQDARTLIGKPTCFDCLEKNRIQTNANADYHANYLKRKAKCESEHICVVCSKPLGSDTHKTCSACRAKHREQYAKNRTNIPRSEASTYGICSLCLKNPRYLHYNTCEDCYNTVIAKFSNRSTDKWKKQITAEMRYYV